MDKLYYKHFLIEDALIAGSIGSYGACQNNMSEYIGTFVEKLTIDVSVLDFNFMQMSKMFFFLGINWISQA